MCAHSVIGQEFNNVAIVIDEHFKYTKNGKLTASNQYYSQRQMLYQIITRARKKTSYHCGQQCFYASTMYRDS